MTEVRYLEDELDEVVTSEAEFVHLEQMDVNSWWLGIDLPGERRISLFLNARGKITANVSEAPIDLVKGKR